MPVLSSAEFLNKGYWTCPKMINLSAGNISLFCIAASCYYRRKQSSVAVGQYVLPLSKIIEILLLACLTSTNRESQVLLLARHPQFPMCPLMQGTFPASCHCVL